MLWTVPPYPLTRRRGWLGPALATWLLVKLRMKPLKLTHGRRSRTWRRSGATPTGGTAPGGTTAWRRARHGPCPQRSKPSWRPGRPRSPPRCHRPPRRPPPRSRQPRSTTQTRCASLSHGTQAAPSRGHPDRRRSARPGEPARPPNRAVSKRKRRTPYGLHQVGNAARERPSRQPDGGPARDRPC